MHGGIPECEVETSNAQPSPSSDQAVVHSPACSCEPGQCDCRLADLERKSWYLVVLMFGGTMQQVPLDGDTMEVLHVNYNWMNSASSIKHHEALAGERSPEIMGRVSDRWMACKPSDEYLRVGERG